MSHPISEGPVKLLKIVTPGAYWIQCAECEGSYRTPTSIRNKPHPNEDFYPQQGDKVFVRDGDGFFYRGTVCGRWFYPNCDYGSYIVQVIDTFQVKAFNQMDVYPTYGESSSACKSAHLVSLYNVLPEIPPLGYGMYADSAESKAFEKAVPKWEAFEKAVTNWDRSVAAMDSVLSTGCNVGFTFLQSKIINGSIYGVFLMSTPLVARTEGRPKCHDLSDYLCFEKLGVKMMSRFEAVIETIMSRLLIDSTTLLATFDPFAPATFEPQPAPPLEEPSEPVDIARFQVHPDDVALHESLISQECYINILYTGAPPKHDTIVRYVSPDGNVVLGTVKNFDFKCAEEINKATAFEFNGQVFSFSRSNETPELDHSGELFENLPSYYNGDRSLLSLKPLLSYDFNETLRNFQATGGVFKELLLPYPLSSTVEKLTARHLDSLGVESLREWQKLCLPTLSCRKNLVVLGPRSTGKFTMATISALSWMHFVNPPSPDSIHPQLIIFIHDFNRAEKVGNLCKQLTNFRVILSTSAFITEKQKELAKDGCDVLITTPSNWAKLVSENVFDYSRLNHVIFDGFDRLHEFYAKDIIDIFEALDLSSSRRIQAVLLSNSWGAVIGDREIRKTVFEFPTLCIMDAVLSCLYYKLEPNAVFVEHNDWIRQLEKILLENGSAKRLLLCENETEGRSIFEKISHIDGVLFAHESLDKDSALKILREWDWDEDQLLICTDNSVEEFDFMKERMRRFHEGFKDVIFISWMTSSWTTLCNRLMAFRTKQDLSLASTYLFVDCKKLEELLLIENISNSIRCINGELVEHLSAASTQAEYSKVHVNVCPSIFMFGKCEDVPLCPLRHVLLPDDEPEILNLNQFLNVDILRVHSAFRYSVRVTEIVSNYENITTKNTRSLISNLNLIENGLAESYRKRSSLGELEIGQLVGASIVTSKVDPLLRRATVKSTPEDGSSDLYSLSLVDFEDPDVHLPVSQLFLLSDDVAMYPRDVVDLYITGLMPADTKSYWQNDTKAFMTYAINQIVKDTDFLAGKVELVTANRSVLVDTLHYFKEHGARQKTTVSIIGTAFCSVKDLILESGFCVENFTHPSELFVQPASPVFSSRVPLDIVGKFRCRTDLPTLPVPGVVSEFINPGFFYVQLIDELEKLRNFEKVLSSTLGRSNRELQLIALGELCAVQYEGAWKRALIFDIFADLEDPHGSVQIVLVDHGYTMSDVQLDELFCLPDDLGSAPFFAVHCKLGGIKPFRDEGWHKEAVEEFGGCVRQREDKKKTLIVKFCGIEDIDGFPSHLVVLWEPNDPDHSINSNLARLGFVNFDQKTKHLLNEPLTTGSI